jgi:hypothetical protein
MNRRIGSLLLTLRRGTKRGRNERFGVAPGFAFNPAPSHPESHAGFHPDRIAIRPLERTLADRSMIGRCHMREWEVSSADRQRIAESEWRGLVKAARELEPAFISANIGEVWVREGEAEVGSFWAADYVDDGEVVVMFDGDPGVVMAAFERLRCYAAGRLLD